MAGPVGGVTLSRPRIVLAIALAIAVAPAASVGCSPKASAPPARGRVIFDVGHGEIFGPDDEGRLGQSRAVAAIRDAGFSVDVTSAPLTASTLGGAAGVFLAGPMRPLRDEESRALDEYVRAGGTLIVSIHVPFPVMRLPARFGLPVVTSIVMTTEPREPDSGVFTTSDVADDPVTEGVEGVLVLSGWRVTTSTPDARLIVSSGRESWVDDGDKVLTRKDAMGPFGMVGVSRMGRGMVVVAGDDAIFANAGFSEADNARLFRNIVELMGRPQEL